jgi:hypothetical protein
MSLRGWLRERLRRRSSQQINLVEQPAVQVPPPSRLGLDVELRVMPWSVARLNTIFRDAERFPTADSQRQARHARHCLSGFWLSAPIDQLRALYGSDLGELQRCLLAGSLPQQPLAPDELEWRDRLAHKLHTHWEAPERVNLLLALMPYFPAGGMRVEQPLEQVPDWLLEDYASYCDPALRERLQQPVAFLQPSPAAKTVNTGTEAAGDADNLPPLSERRGQDALALFEQGELVNRMAALNNLYGLDPTDETTRAELAGLRGTIAQLWLDVSPDQLEQLYRTPVGVVHRSLITSGFSGELVTEQDGLTRQVLASQLEDLSQPGAINRLLAALLFFEAGKVAIVDGREFIPQWLQQELALN